jgi:peptide/nickel transport system substrate-binding protein
MSGQARAMTALLLAVAALGSTVATTSAATGGTATAAPKRGGSVTWALEAETPTGFCPATTQAAASGLQELNAMFDTLVTINSQNKYVPYLAKSVDHNADYTKWTITVRSGVKFHDGTLLDAAAVKLNLDTFRNLNPKISAPLVGFVFQDVADVTVTGPLTVVITTKRPWIAFPAFLYGINRYGISSPAALRDQATCETRPIGTGPFRFVEWRQNDSLTVERNPDYWQKGLPYLDKIVFKPTPETQQRESGLLSGDFDISQQSGPRQIIDLEKRAKRGEVNMVVSDRGSEVGYGMLNVSKPPFDDPIAREAVAYAGDVQQLNAIRNKGLFTIASGPFPPGSPAYLKDTGLPKHNLKKARALVKQYEQKHGQPLAFEYLTATDPELLALAELSQAQDKQAGIDVTIRQVDQGTMIANALAGRFQLEAWRNHPGGDPDGQYVWWHSGSPVNFGRINDPVIDKLLDTGRVETNPQKRTAIYKQVNRRFAQQLYDLWVWYTLWGISSQTSIKGLDGPPLPDGNGRPFALFAGVIPVAGISKAK